MRRSSSDEGWLTTLLQIGLPFLVAGLGMVAAGLVLDDVQHWPVFIEVPELFILVPALLGLKVRKNNSPGFNFNNHVLFGLACIVEVNNWRNWSLNLCNSPVLVLLVSLNIKTTFYVQKIKAVC